MDNWVRFVFGFTAQSFPFISSISLQSKTHPTTHTWQIRPSSAALLPSLGPAEWCADSFFCHLWSPIRHKQMGLQPGNLASKRNPAFFKARTDCVYSLGYWHPHLDLEGWGTRGLPFQLSFRSFLQHRPVQVGHASWRLWGCAGRPTSVQRGGGCC